MPTYEYACTVCDHRFEAVQSFSDPNLSVCPVCQGKLRKLFSSVGIVFRGPGFYRTDSRAGSSVVGGDEGGKKDKAAKNGDGGKSKGGEKSDTKSNGDKAAAKSSGSDSSSSSSKGETKAAAS